MKCKICKRDGFKNEYGLYIHMAKDHGHQKSPDQRHQHNHHRGPPRDSGDHHRGPPRGSQEHHRGPPRGSQEHHRGPPRDSGDHHRGPPRDSREHPRHNDESAMVIKCPFCDKDDIKSEGGLSHHISSKHSSSTDDRGSRPSTGTRDRRDDRDVGAMVIKCRICGKDGFKSERGLSCHITTEHSGSAHGKGSRPSFCTNDKRDDGTRPKTPRHKEPERHNSDRDVVKGVARVQRDSLQRGSPDEFPLKNLQNKADKPRNLMTDPRHQLHYRIANLRAQHSPYCSI